MRRLLGSTVMGLALMLGVTACGVDGTGADGSPRGGTDTAGVVPAPLDRSAVLSSCPAQAPSFEGLESPDRVNAAGGVAEPENTDVPDPDLEKAVASVQRYLETLPEDQTAGTFHQAGTVVVLVTRGAPEVLAELQSRTAGVPILVETTRYSTVELRRVGDAILNLKGLPGGFSVGSGNGNGRVEVMVPNDLSGARDRILTVADPCSFVVARGGPAGRDGGSATAGIGRVDGEA